MNNKPNIKYLKPKIYKLVDSFLVEAQDQDGNYRSLSQLNRDRHLFVDNLIELLKENIQ